MHFHIELMQKTIMGWALGSLGNIKSNVTKLGGWREGKVEGHRKYECVKLLPHLYYESGDTV